MPSTGLRILLSEGSSTSAREALTVLGSKGRKLTRRGPYADSVEELTPLRTDWPSAVPLIATAALLVVRPRAAGWMQRKGWGRHLLGAKAIALITQGLI